MTLIQIVVIAVLALENFVWHLRRAHGSATMYNFYLGAGGLIFGMLAGWNQPLSALHILTFLYAAWAMLPYEHMASSRNKTYEKGEDRSRFARFALDIPVSSLEIIVWIPRRPSIQISDVENLVLVGEALVKQCDGVSDPILIQYQSSDLRESHWVTKLREGYLAKLHYPKEQKKISKNYPGVSILVRWDAPTGHFHLTTSSYLV